MSDSRLDLSSLAPRSDASQRVASAVTARIAATQPVALVDAIAMQWKPALIAALLIVSVSLGTIARKAEKVRGASSHANVEHAGLLVDPRVAQWMAGGVAPPSVEQLLASFAGY
jgi:hypothetical protein